MKTTHTLRPMHSQTAGYLVLFGLFLILLGVMGYMTHPEKARTALIFGGGFGALWMLFGILSARGLRWSWPAALATTALLALVCLWRASLSWLAVADGQTEKAFASLIVSLMFAVSASMLFLLLRDRQPRGVKEPA